MPNFDKTGPEGEGPMTGRGIGQQLRAQGIDPQNQPEQQYGRGRGRGGRGFGRGCGGNRSQNFPGFPLPEETISADPTLRGVGRGGIPYGCGMGRCFGGGRNR